MHANETYCRLLGERLQISPPPTWGRQDLGVPLDSPHELWMWDVEEGKLQAFPLQEAGVLTVEATRDRISRLTHHFLEKWGPTRIYEGPIGKWPHGVQLALRSGLNTVEAKGFDKIGVTHWRGFHNREAPTPLLSLYKREQIEELERLCFTNFLVELTGNILTLFPDQYPFVKGIWDTRYLTDAACELARMLVEKLGVANEAWFHKAATLSLPVPLIRTDVVFGADGQVWSVETNSRAYGLQEMGPLHAASRKALEVAGASPGSDLNQAFVEQVQCLREITGYPDEPVAIVGGLRQVGYLATILTKAGIPAIPVPKEFLALVGIAHDGMQLPTEQIRRYCANSPWPVEVPDMGRVHQALLYTGWGHSPAGSEQLRRIFEAGLTLDHPLRLLGNSQGPRLENNKAYYALLATSPVLQEEVARIVDYLCPGVGEEVVSTFLRHRPPALSVRLKSLKKAYGIEALRVEKSGKQLVLRWDWVRIGLNRQQHPVMERCRIPPELLTQLETLLGGEYFFIKQATGTGAQKLGAFPTADNPLWKLLDQLRPYPREVPLVLEKGVGGGRIPVLTPWRDWRKGTWDELIPRVELFLNLPIQGEQQALAGLVFTVNPVREMLGRGEVPWPEIYQQIWDEFSRTSLWLNEHERQRQRKELEMLLERGEPIPSPPIIHGMSTDLLVMAHVRE